MTKILFVLVGADAEALVGATTQLLPEISAFWDRKEQLMFTHTCQPCCRCLRKNYDKVDICVCEHQLQFSILKCLYYQKMSILQWRHKLKRLGRYELSNVCGQSKCVCKLGIFFRTASTSSLPAGQSDSLAHSIFSLSGVFSEKSSIQLLFLCLKHRKICIPAGSCHCSGLW